MKRLAVLLLVCISGFGQVPDKGKVITFDRADVEHCKVAMIEGRSMLQSEYGGTSVAVGLPVSTADGDFRVFVFVKHTGPGKAQVKPKEFSALYSDPAHTRFSFYDKAAKMDQAREREQTRESDVLGAGSQALPGMEGQVRTPGGVDDKDRQARLRQLNAEDPNRPVREQEEAREEQQGKSLPGTAVTPDQLYLRGSTLHQGDTAEGFVYFRKPKGSKLNVGPRDLLFEIDIQVNGVVFRFG